MRVNAVAAQEGTPSTGFAFGAMENIVVDVHWLQRNRANDIVEVINERPELLGLSIDENTAVVLEGDVFEVVAS